MGNIFSSIQHFFLVIFTAVTVILPFHKLSVHPIPSSSPSPSTVSIISPSPSPTSQPPKKVLGVHNSPEDKPVVSPTPLITPIPTALPTPQITLSQPTASVSIEAICNAQKEQLRTTYYAMYGHDPSTDAFGQYALSDLYSYCLTHSGNMSGYNIPKPPTRTETNTVPPAQDCSIISNTVANIKSNWQPSIDAQTRAITSALGARGLLPSSPEGQSEITAALQPIYAQENDQIAQFCLQILRQGNSCTCP